MAEKFKRQIENGSEDAHNKEISTPDSSKPMVFYCNQCSAIVGDSVSWLYVNEIIQAIVLQRVTNQVKQCKELFMCSAGPDKGSTFVELKCSNCSEIIGRMYKSTSQEIDHFRNAYHLYASKIESYTVGYGQVGTVDIDAEDHSQISSCLNKIRKIQEVIIKFNERLSVIEEQLGIEYVLSDNEYPTSNKSDTSEDSPTKHLEKVPLSSHKRKLTESFSGLKKKAKKI